MSVAKEGKVVEQKKSLQTLLDTHEGQKMTWTSLFLTSPTPTVYSSAQSYAGRGLENPKIPPGKVMSIYSIKINPSLVMMRE